MCKRAPTCADLVRNSGLFDAAGGCEGYCLIGLHSVSGGTIAQPAAAVAGDGARGMRIAVGLLGGCVRSAQHRALFSCLQTLAAMERAYIRALHGAGPTSRSSSRITGPIRRRCITHCRAPGSQVAPALRISSSY